MNITVLDGHTLNPGDLSWAPLSALGSLTVYDRTPSDLLLSRATGSQILLTNKTPLRADVLQHLAAHGLQYIGVMATGYDIVDAPAAKALGIPVTNAGGYSTASAAQVAIGLMLELTSRVGLHSASVAKGDWSRCPDFSYQIQPVTELSGQTLGILGFGRIGQRVAAIARALGMRVITLGSGPNRTDPRPITEPRPGTDAVFPSLQAMLPHCDVLSLHCPLTPQTQHIISRDTLSLMKPTAILINTARGKLINEPDLAHALATGVIAAAGLDVLSTEPPPPASPSHPPSHPLIGLPNCLITPHIGWASTQARQRLMLMVTDNVRAFLTGSPTNVVNP